MPIQLENPQLRDLMGTYFQSAIGLFIDSSGDLIIPHPVVIDNAGAATIRLDNSNDINTVPTVLFGSSAIIASNNSLVFMIDADNNDTDRVFSVRKDSDVLPGTELFVIQENNNIGIANSSPQTLLHIGAGADAPASASSLLHVVADGGASMTVRDSTNDIEGIFYAGPSHVVSGSQSNHPYSLRSNNITAITIATNQKVGVGNTSPQTPLHVGPGTDAPTATTSILHVTDNSPTSMTIRDSANDSEVLIHATLGYGLIGTRTNDQFRIRTNNTNSLYIDTSQNVGIRTGSPAGTFHAVTGAGSGVSPNSGIKDVTIDSDATNIGLSFTSIASGIANIAFADAGSNVAGRIRYSHADDSFRVYVNTTERFTILDTNGRTGVGNAAPAAKLSVDQSNITATIAVLELDQADLSEEFIDFVTTVGAGNPIDTAAIGTYYGKARVAVNGTFKYIALYNS